ncbi:hypothetical protein [uncultured Jatrophihabitans sp.]|uniref:hypothetical protein n=1 Tax=uncultured Jatrophihabitans sp. TaxID=1610747 RepID=UPI0035CA2555
MRRQSARVVQTGPEGHVGPVRFLDTVTGAEMVTTGPGSLTYHLDNRQVEIPVDYGRHQSLSVYGVHDNWDDGSPLTTEERRNVADMLVLVAEQRGWKLDVVYDLVTGEKR